MSDNPFKGDPFEGDNLFMTPFQTETAKQDVIVNIHLMQEQMGVQKTPFDSLWKLPLDTLRQQQYEMIPEYNKAVTSK